MEVYTMLMCIFLIQWMMSKPHTNKTNIVVPFTDDLGYGDIGDYRHTTSITSNLDMLARKSLLFTQFYTSSCSRAALLTGRLQTRSGVWLGVFETANIRGLPPYNSGNL